MKTNEELIEEFKKRWDKGEDWDYVRDVLTQKDAEVAEERRRIITQVRNIVRQGKVNVFNTKESNVEWLMTQLDQLTPHPTDIRSGKNN